MHLFTRVISVLFLVVFLLETTGVSLLHHICLVGNTNEIKSINGFGGEQSVSCCCDEDAFCPVSDEPGRGQSVKAQPCCFEVNTLVKFSFVSLASCHFLYQPVLLGMESFLTTIPVNPVNEVILPDTPFFRFHSPPYFGIHLLRAIHQIKIPIQSSSS